MNFTDAMKVSAYMGDFLSRKNVFKNKRNDTVYKIGMTMPLNLSNQRGIGSHNLRLMQ